MEKTFKRPKILEKDVTKAVRSCLRMLGIFHWKVWQGLGSTKGISDIIALYKGHAIFIEVKGPTGKLSEDQQLFLRDANYHGGIGIVVRSADDIMNAMVLIRSDKIQEAREKYKS